MTIAYEISKLQAKAMSWKSETFLQIGLIRTRYARGQSTTMVIWTIKIMKMS